MKLWTGIASAAFAFAACPGLAETRAGTVPPAAPAVEPVPAPVAVPAFVPGVTVSPAVVAVPIAMPAPAAPAFGTPQPGDGAEDKPPPPPEPPAEDAAEPRRLVRYFCNAWKDKDYERMWWAMTPEYREKTTLDKFRSLFESDAEANGGLLDENIVETGKTRNGDEGVRVELTFKFPRAKRRTVAAVAARQPGGAFRIAESPIIPMDLNDF